MNWLNQSNMEKAIRFHSGIYKFKIPYLKHDLVPNKDNEVKVYYCDVEMHVGREDDLQEGLLATVVMTGVDAITNDIEHIATSIYHTMFQNVFYTHLMKQNQLVNKIKWVEKYEPGILSVYPRGHWVDVKLQWNEKQKSYSKPSWYGSPEESWYVNSIQPNDHSSTTNPVNNYSVAEEIIKLAALKDQGILTEEEFTVKKKQLLGI